MKKTTIAAIAASALLLTGCASTTGTGRSSAPAPAPAPVQQTMNVQYVNVATEDGSTVPCVIFLDRVEDAGGITCNWDMEN